MTWRRRLLETIFRKKLICAEPQSHPPFKRCLGVIDLYAVGVGIGLGCGAYILMPFIICLEAGPSSVLSILIAGITALMAGSFYAELSLRFPRTGTAYVSTFVTMGELSAFIVGWSVLLDYLILAAVVAKVWSDYLDYLLNGEVKRFLSHKMPMQIATGFAPYPDIPAFCLILLTTCGACILKKSITVVTFILTVIALVISVAIICVGFFHVDSHNWRDEPGFFPYKAFGTLRGAATIYISFIGHDAIASLVEETKDPERGIPRVITSANILCFVFNFIFTLAVTLTYKWSNMELVTTLPKAFIARGIEGSGYVVGIGAFVALLASIISIMTTAPRLSFAMANDRLLFSCFSAVSKVTHLPVVATFTAGLFVGVVSLLADSRYLTEMISIGALFSTLTMSINILLLRYNPTNVGVVCGYDDIESDIKATQFHSKKSSVSDAIEEGTSEKDTFNKGVSCRQFVDGYYKGDELHTRVIDEYENKRLRDVAKGKPEDSASIPLISGENDAERSCYVLVRSQGESGSYSSLLTTNSIFSQPPSSKSFRTMKIALFVFVSAVLSMSIITVCGSRYISRGDWWSICFICFFIIGIVGSIIILVKQPRNNTKLVYEAPYVPCIPIIAIVLVSFMIVSLPVLAWIRFFSLDIFRNSNLCDVWCLSNKTRNGS